MFSRCLQKSNSIAFFRKKEGYNAGKRMLGVVRLNSLRRWLSSCMQFVTFHSMFENDWDLARVQWWKVWELCSFTEKIGKHDENSFVLKMGASAARLRGPLGPPPIFRTKAFQNVSPFFCEITNIPYLSSLKPRAKSESLWKIVWNVTNWIHERSNRRTELSRTTPSILWLALYPAFFHKKKRYWRYLQKILTFEQNITDSWKNTFIDFEYWTSLLKVWYRYGWWCGELPTSRTFKF